MDKMDNNNLDEIYEVKESNFARWISYTAWIPGIGFLCYVILTPLAFLQFNKGYSGFKHVRKNFSISLISTITVYAVLVLWGGLPEKYYPDALFKRHGKYVIMYQPEIKFKTSPYGDEIFIPDSYQQTRYYYFDKRANDSHFINFDD